MRTRFCAGALIVALASSACGQREEPEPDPTANIDLPTMYNPDPALQDTTTLQDTAGAPAAGTSGGTSIVGEDTIKGPYTPPDTTGPP